MSEFNSDNQSLRRNRVALIVYKRARNAVLGCNLIDNRMILACFQGKPFNITVIQVYALTTDAKEAEVDWFNEDLQYLLGLLLLLSHFSHVRLCATP